MFNNKPINTMFLQYWRDLAYLLFVKTLCFLNKLAVSQRLNLVPNTTGFIKVNSVLTFVKLLFCTLYDIILKSLVILYLEKLFNLLDAVNLVLELASVNKFNKKDFIKENRYDTFTSVNCNKDDLIQTLYV